MKRLITGLLAMLLAGCEAPLVLDGVEQERERTARRSDRFQQAAANGDTLVVVGNMGVVATSTDRGKSWGREVLPGKPALIDVVVCPDGTFLALDYQRKIWVRDGSGETSWRGVPVQSEDPPQAMTCDAEGRVWVVGGFSSILHTADLGQTWSSNSLQEDLHFTSVQFVDSSIAYLTGEFGVVVRSSDGGQTWQNLSPLPDEFYPQDAYFQDARTGWVVGLNGTIFRTTDGARTWQRQSVGTDAPLYSIAARDGQLFIVGGNGVVIRGDGRRWALIDHGRPIRFYLRGIVPLQDGKLLVAGGAGALYLVEG